MFPIAIRCPVVSEPSGGVSRLLLHHTWLREAGFCAFLQSYEPGKGVVAPKDAVLAVPEGDTEGLRARQSKVIVAQSLRMPARPVSDVLGILAASEAVRKQARAFLGKDAVVVPPSVDGSRFFPGKKGRLIAYMPRRAGSALSRVLGRTRRPGWEHLPVDRLSSDETADCLSRAALFISAAEGEGFGLPMLEAMASGCVVVGYAAGGGNEYLRGGENALVAPDGAEDVLEARLREAMDLFDQEEHEAIAERARETASLFSPERERTAILAFWSEILRKSEGAQVQDGDH